MITKGKLDIYKHFNGDIDGWARIGTKKQKMIMEDKDWLLIESFLQDIHLVRNGLASEKYVKAMNVRLRENCDNEETIQKLKDIP